METSVLLIKMSKIIIKKTFKNKKVIEKFYFKFKLKKH